MYPEIKSIPQIKEAVVEKKAHTSILDQLGFSDHSELLPNDPKKKYMQELKE